MRNQLFQKLEEASPENKRLLEKLSEIEHLEEKLFKTPESSNEFRSEKNTFHRDAAPLHTAAVSEILRGKFSGGTPEALFLTEDERLFIDFGWFSERLCPEKPSFMKFEESVFHFMTASGYFKETFSEMFGLETSSFNSEKTLLKMNARMNMFESKLRLMTPIVLSEGEEGISKTDAQNLVEEWGGNLVPYACVAARTADWRDGTEEERAFLGRSARRFAEISEKLEMFISSKERENRDIVLRIRSFLSSCMNTAIQAAYVTKEDEKSSRRRDVFKRRFAGDELAARTAFLELPAKKCEYASLMSKRVRRPYSPFIEGEHLKSIMAPGVVDESVQSVLSADPKLLEAPRIRMYGLPRVVVLPGCGVGAYDWSDNTLILPVAPLSGDCLKALSFAAASFRWDTDEERLLKDTYNKLKENRKKNIVDLANSFASEYFLWVTKESKGYRILPKESHKWFSQSFARKLEVL